MIQNFTVTQPIGPSPQYSATFRALSIVLMATFLAFLQTSIILQTSIKRKGNYDSF